MNVIVNWTLSWEDSADSYLINITTNAPEVPYGGLLNITTGSVKLTGFMADYEYNITIRGVNCGSQEGGESELLTIRPQGMFASDTHCMSVCLARYVSGIPAYLLQVKCVLLLVVDHNGCM